MGDIMGDIFYPASLELGLFFFLFPSENNHLEKCSIIFFKWRKSWNKENPLIYVVVPKILMDMREQGIFV